MHISEGVLSFPVLAAGAGLALPAVLHATRRLPWERIMSVGVFAAGFFIASLVHVPLGPGSVHLILNGLLGAMLGWAALPAVAAALFLQALLFHFGGLTTLGVNICIMGFPAVACGLLFRRRLSLPGAHQAAAFACGACAVLFSAILCALALALSGEAFVPAARAIVLFHLPIMLIEGALTAVIVAFVSRAAPDMLGADHA
jgi:cobalt/nickel transport system permease protein